MSLQHRLLLAVLGWLSVVTVLHLWLNTHVLDRSSSSKVHDGQQFRVGFLPVT
jgi:hypothetical protein